MCMRDEGMYDIENILCMYNIIVGMYDINFVYEI